LSYFNFVLPQLCPTSTLSCLNFVLPQLCPTSTLSYLNFVLPQFCPTSTLFYCTLILLHFVPFQFILNAICNMQETKVISPNHTYVPINFRTWLLFSPRRLKLSKTSFSRTKGVAPGLPDGVFSYQIYQF
jgi:hypothetical protein